MKNVQRIRHVFLQLYKVTSYVANFSAYLIKRLYSIAYRDYGRNDVALSACADDRGNSDEGIKRSGLCYKA